MLVPKEIDNIEILVRFVFLDNFKKNVLKEDRISAQDVFLDTRLVGISLQRKKFTTEKFCKMQAKSINNKTYVGFILFRKSDYLDACQQFITQRPTFNSAIEFTPLDENNNYLFDRQSIRTTDNGNPSHSDIIYLNPAINNDEIKPNISLRIFSKILFEKSKLIIDANYEKI